MKTFERLLPTEEADIKEIVAGILHAQIRTATAENRPIMRGTHTKGVCVKGSFEIYDLAKTIEDPILRDRLSQGLFAKPGTYPVTIRFANADVTIAADYVEDVRAISFAVACPPGVLGPDAVRHDFSLNAATTFPINDAHSFAIFTRVLEADGFLGKLGALASLSPSELIGLLMIAVRAAPQKRKTLGPYQSRRYWSNTPFRHGPDEAVKYSATALKHNPTREPEKSYDMLKDELIRHVTSDQRMSEFEFGIQFLDSDRMRRYLRKHDDIYWVENASYEWHETQAPFHAVGKISLERNGRLTDDECQNFYIDVTEHSTPLSHPLGSLNRARWFAESASRHARLKTDKADAAVDPTALPDSRNGAPLPVPSGYRGTWIGNLTVRSLAKAAAIVGFIVFGTVSLGAMLMSAYVQSERGALPLEHLSRVIYPSNGFGAGVDDTLRQRFYYTPQGAGLKDIRYSWFKTLEMPWGRTKISDPTVMSRFGFLVDQPTDKNPDRLPVGFTRHFDQTLNEELLDVTCAACHTGQINVTKNGETQALRIDGGQANHAFTDASFGHFLPTLITSLLATTTNPFKFNRFARQTGHSDGKWKLYKDLWSVNWTFMSIAWNENIWRGLSPTEEGFGRTDALARIGNTVFAENLSSDNYRVGNAPVNFPALWNIWKFDWVQYNASVSQPMARNMGEAMGVGARYALMDAYGKPLPPSERFRSSARIDDLNTIEHTLWELKPPAWNEDMLGKIDTVKADSGLKLFNKNCVGCHGPHIAPPGIKLRNAPGKNADQPEWIVATLCANDIGTDSNAAHNFSVNTVDVRRTGLTAIDLRRVARRVAEQWIARDTVWLRSEIVRVAKYPDSVAIYAKQLNGARDAMEQDLAQIDPAKLPLGAALSYLGTMIREKAYADGHYTDAQRAQLDGFGTLDRPQVLDAYKSKPLAGIWATPPFLHNGSVPTIYQMLSPVIERDTMFQVGSREYDPVHLGLAKVQGFWTFDTRKSGNRNTGHEFSKDYRAALHDHQVRPGVIGPYLAPDDRLRSLEHLKIRDDDVDGPKAPNLPPSCGVRSR